MGQSGPSGFSTHRLKTTVLDCVRELSLLPRETGMQGLLGFCEFQVSSSEVVEGNGVPSAASVPEPDLTVRLLPTLLPLQMCGCLFLPEES